MCAETHCRVVIVSVLVSGLTRVTFAESGHFRIRGTIDAIDAQTLQLTTREDEKQTPALASDPVVTAMVSASATDIETRGYIGTAR